MSKKEVSVSVIIPTKCNLDELRQTLERIQACTPAPAEILVHVDGGDDKTASWLRRDHSNVRVWDSSRNVGPGGGRNRLIEVAGHEIVASFDDDSYPIDDDYFARLIEMFSAFPEADLIAASEFTRDDTIQKATQRARWTSSFIGCGCAYRRSSFLDTEGYMELSDIYGAEEQDLALQFSGQSKRILETDWLRVFHDTDYEDRGVNTRIAWIANTALLVALRYPVSLYWYGALQVLNAMVFAIGQGRYEAIPPALVQIPKKIWKYRHKRAPLSASSVWRYLELRSAPEPAFGLYPNKQSDEKGTASHFRPAPNREI